MKAQAKVGGRDSVVFGDGLTNSCIGKTEDLCNRSWRLDTHDSKGNGISRGLIASCVSGADKGCVCTVQSEEDSGSEMVSSLKLGSLIRH